MASDGLFSPAISWKRTAVTGYEHDLFFSLKSYLENSSENFTFCLDGSLDMDLVMNHWLHGL